MNKKVLRSCGVANKKPMMAANGSTMPKMINLRVRAKFTAAE
jgi:hypothetical protein